jgi:polar amino acid transport system substrate-binding protein
MPIARLVLAGLLIAAAAPPELAPTGTLRAAFLATNPVQGRVDAKTGAVTGPVADLTSELARRLGVPRVITPVADPAAVIDAITSGKADIGFLAYEAARATQVEFSDAYLLAGSAYAVRADSPIKASADVDRPGITIGAVKGVSQQIYVSGNVRNARIELLPAQPPNEVLAKMLLDRTLDAFAANRGRMEELVKSTPGLRVLDDNFMVVSQAIVVDKKYAARVAELNRFVADVRRSGFVQQSIDRSGVAGLQVAR